MIAEDLLHAHMGSICEQLVLEVDAAMFLVVDVVVAAASVLMAIE